MTKKTLKQRVNISVDPAIHGRFAEYADRANQTVSGILNEVMDIFCQDAKQWDADNPVMHHLRQRLLDADSREFQCIVRKLVLDAGFKESTMETNNLGQTGEIPPGHRSEWYGVVGKNKVGIKLAFDLSREPDITLGRALLFRGLRKCDRILLVVPYRMAIPPHVLTAAAQSGLDVVGVDLLGVALRPRAYKKSPENGAPKPSQTNIIAHDTALIQYLEEKA